MWHFFGLRVVRAVVGTALLGTLASACATAPVATGKSAALQRIQTVVVIYAENHS